MASRLIAAMLLAGLLLFAAVPGAMAFPFSPNQLIKDHVLYQVDRVDDFSDRPYDPGMGWEIYLNIDETAGLASEMIRDEHWLELVKFERNSSTILPVLSAQLFMTYGEFAHHRIKRTRGENERSRVTTVAKLPAPGIPVLMSLLFPGYVKGEAIGLLERDTSQRGRKPRQGYNLLNWLFEDEGVFSGEEWDWENFLPRLLSVVALVVAGLFLIEFLRFLVMLGMRAVGTGVDKRNR